MLTVAKFTKHAYELFQQIHIKFSTFGYDLEDDIQTLDETIKDIEKHWHAISSGKDGNQYHEHEEQK